MINSINNSFLKLKKYCEKENFKGWDPYDGLNSKLFRAIPFIRNSAIFRLIIIQGFKRNPMNFRRIALVSKDHNAKGIALFLSGYCNLYQTIQNGMNVGIPEEKCLEKICYLADLLLSLQSRGYSGACWGYNFDWESKAFFLPKDTPTVVATSFAVEALFCAYDITQNEDYFETAISSSNFILKDLNRIPKPNGFMFSYSPLDNRAVYNATLLGTKTLSLIYKYTKDEELKNMAYITALAVCDVQNPDGSFPHSDQVGNAWRDNFHTGFKLESLALYQKWCNDFSFKENIESGYDYWINHFFIPQKGIAKYYDTSTENDLIDLHCVAQSIPTICKLDKFNVQQDLIKRILDWAVLNMQSKKGYFFFQKRGNVINRICYMRWPNAWMFYGFSYWFKFLVYKDEENI